MQNTTRQKVVLFVEDDEQIRLITSQMLENAGYRVLSAENGELGYNMGLQHLDEVDILLTDLHMPKIKGKDLIELLLAEKPELKVLISSGYIRDKEQTIEIQGRVIPYLIKPYSRNTLLETMEAI